MPSLPLQLHLGFADWLMYGTPVMLILFPIIIGWLYIVFKPKLNLHFEAEFAKIHMNKKRILTLAIFVAVAILWIFGGYLNPIISQLLDSLNQSAVLIVWSHSLQQLLFV